MGFVAFGSKHIAKKSIDEQTFRKIAEYLGISKAEVDRLMADNPRCIYIHRGRDAANTGGSGGSGSGSGSGGE
jgi:hypothetical protein